MERLAQLWGMWRHGAALAFIYAAGVGIVCLATTVAAWGLNAALGLLGRGADEHSVFRLVLALFWLWAPLGFGLAARYAPSDKLKPQNYPETA